MPGWNLPPGVTLADIDRLFEESDESQCLDTEVEEKAAQLTWTDEELAELAKWEPIF